MFSELGKDGYFSWIDAELQYLHPFVGPEDILRKTFGEPEPICGSQSGSGTRLISPLAKAHITPLPSTEHLTCYLTSHS